MAHEPLIPHFGNQVPYTTAAEDRVAALRKELEKAEKEIEQN